MVYLGECDYYIDHIIDLISHNQVVSNPFSNKSLEAIEDEMGSMTHNSV